MGKLGDDDAETAPISWQKLGAFSGPRLFIPDAGMIRLARCKRCEYVVSYQARIRGRGGIKERAVSHRKVNKCPHGINGRVPVPAPS
jgi:hypothetical protein